MPFPRNPNPTEEELAEYAAIDALKAEIDYVIEQRTEAFAKERTADRADAQQVYLQAAANYSIIHLSLLAELEAKE